MPHELTGAVQNVVDFTYTQVVLKDAVPLRADSSKSIYREISLFLPDAFDQLHVLHFHNYGFNQETLKYLDWQIMKLQAEKMKIVHFLATFSTLLSIIIFKG